MTLNLRDICEDIKQRSTLKGPSLPKKTQMKMVTESLGVSMLANEMKREPKDYDIIAQELIDKYYRGEKYTNRDYKDAAWCLWQTTPSLATYEEIFNNIIEKLQETPNRRLFNNYAASFIQSYDSDNSQIARLSAVLQYLVYQWNNPWAALEQNYTFFDMHQGPHLLAQAALSRKMSIVELLSKHGLPSSDSESGYVRMATARALENIAQSRDNRHLERIQTIKSFALTDNLKLRFSGQDKLVADALIKPFQGITPEKNIKDEYLRLILSLFSDPRLHPARWAYMPELANIIRGWLTEQSLRQFLDIVDETAIQRMWKYRRAFWEAVYEEGLVSEAWVVLDDLGAKLAKSKYGKDVSFARYSGGKRSALILRIHNGIVVEWSHDGRCNIWYSNDMENPPAMYQKYYNTSELNIYGTGGGILRHQHCFSRSHNSPETYAWQKDVANEIYKLTGHRILESKYRIP